MKKSVIFDVNYLQTLTMSGSQEINHQVIGMHHYPNGHVKEQRPSETNNSNKKRHNEFNIIVIFYYNFV